MTLLQQSEFLSILAMQLANVFLFCAIVGGGYLLIGVLLGHLSLGADAHDAGGHAAGPTDAADHGAATSHAGHGAGHQGIAPQMLGPLSPLVLAMFMACFGLIGMCVQRDGRVGGTMTIASAISGALALSAAMRWIINRIFARTDVSSAPSAAEMIGLPASVSTPIAVGGTGEIAYVVRGTRYNGIARTDAGKTLPRGLPVIITRRDGAVFYVAPASAATLNVDRATGEQNPAAKAATTREAN